MDEITDRLDLQDEMEQKEAEKMSKSKNDVGTHSRLANGLSIEDIEGLF
jgi:hypothetical protein